MIEGLGWGNNDFSFVFYLCGKNCENKSRKIFRNIKICFGIIV